MESSLRVLPAELLDLILGHPSHSYLAINLWMTGDSRLASKLSSGLTYLCLSAKSESSNLLPKILGSLNALRTIKLISSMNNLVRTHRDWQPIISSLPKTLKALIIDSKDATFAVRNFATDLDSATEYIETIYPRGRSNYIDLGTRFPQLETLVLKGPHKHPSRDDDSIEGLTHFLGDCPGVPDTVTHLGLPYIFLGGRYKLGPRMPPSLTFLDTHIIADYEYVSIEEIQQEWDLPHLERITMLQWFHIPTPEDLSWLPRTLKQCSFSYLSPFTLSIAQTLPPALESLHIVASKGPWLSALPKHLTYLDLHLETPIAVAVADLPRMLTHCIVNTLDLLAEQEESQKKGIKTTHETLDWPPSLSFLEARLPGVDKGVLTLLPHTLTDLYIYSLNEDHEIRFDGRELPPGLQKLHARFESNLNIFGALPSSLTYLKIALYGPDGPLTTLSSWSILPPSLTYLKVSLSLPNTFGVLRKNTVVTLPPNLVTFNTWQFHIDWFSTLPRNLRHLSISGVQGTLDAVPEKASAVFSALPALETIRLNYGLGGAHPPAEVGRFPSASLRSLPPTLKSISIPREDDESGDLSYNFPDYFEGWSG